MLNSIDFLPTYFKTRNELYYEFYKPCMENSVKYDRITGYFGSSVFLVINEALRTFVINKGKIRILCSPALSDDDLNAIKSGYSDKKELMIIKYLDEVLEQMLLDYPNSTLLLSKLIAADILEIKLAIYGDNTEAQRLMHDKAGVFTDIQGNSVAFRGSINETFKGVSAFGNSESFDAFTSWDNPKDEYRVELVKDHFEKMWNNLEPHISTFNIPDTSIKKIKSFVSNLEINELIEEVKYELFNKKEKWFAEVGINARKVKPHQELILNNWENNNRQGLFEMCTGSGKTFTALCAIREAIYQRNEIPLVLVPSKLLFIQWYNELIKLFNDEVTLLQVGAGHPIDASKLKMYSNPKLNIKRCILTTYQTASKSQFIDNITWGSHIFYVCDEVHNIGSPQNINLLSVNVGSRIGLSATPKRYFDDLSTNKIIEFFKGIVLPKYLLSDAIRDGVLCEYFYEVTEVELNTYEQEKWNRLTNEINKKIVINKDITNINDIKGLDRLLFERADILKKAEFKITVAENILLKYYQTNHRWLIYLDDTEQVIELKNKLLKHSIFKGNVFEYHTNTDNDLDQTIQHFSTNGAILLSINCLDEGVDIPSIDHAIILSSSKNPRQYIQRRGRVLRKHKDKNFAYIFDCIVVPNSLEEDFEKSLSILRGEIARCMTFAENAKNSKLIRSKIQVIMNNNNITDIEGDYGTNE